MLKKEVVEIASCLASDCNIHSIVTRDKTIVPFATSPFNRYGQRSGSPIAAEKPQATAGLRRALNHRNGHWPGVDSRQIFQNLAAVALQEINKASTILLIHGAESYLRLFQQFLGYCFDCLAVAEITSATDLDTLNQKPANLRFGLNSPNGSAKLIEV
jgi:hypothetical protein